MVPGAASGLRLRLDVPGRVALPELLVLTVGRTWTCGGGADLLPVNRRAGSVPGRAREAAWSLRKQPHGVG